MVAPKQVYQKYPQWIQRIDPGDLDRIPLDSVVAIDDAHLYYYARDFKSSEYIKNLDFLSRESRHKDITIIYTTQQTRVLDVTLISMIDTIIVKKYNTLALEFERPEVRRIITTANNELKGKDKKYCYIVNKGLYGPYDPPDWFNDKISKSFRDKKLKEEPSFIDEAKKYKKDISKIIINIIKAIPI